MHCGRPQTVGLSVPSKPAQWEIAEIKVNKLKKHMLSTDWQWVVEVTGPRGISVLKSSQKFNWPTGFWESLIQGSYPQSDWYWERFYKQTEYTAWRDLLHYLASDGRWSPIANGPCWYNKRFQRYV
jgi:hypothetical protein